MVISVCLDKSIPILSFLFVYHRTGLSIDLSVNHPLYIVDAIRICRRCLLHLEYIPSRYTCNLTTTQLTNYLPPIQATKSLISPAVYRILCTSYLPPSPSSISQSQAIVILPQNPTLESQSQSQIQQLHSPHFPLAPYLNSPTPL